MKSPLLVILPEGCSNPEVDLRSTLENFRLDANDIESIRSHHWDFWYYPESWIGQPAVAARFPSIEPDFSGNLGLARELFSADCWSGIITPDLIWHDLSDHGWQMMREPCAENDAAVTKWRKQYQEILTLFPDHLAAGVIIHC